MLKYFNRENSVKGATSILVITLAFSNLLGLVRDHFLAQKISTDLLDTYYAAFRLPDLIFNVLILGAVSSAFIPVFSALISNNQSKEANKLASNILTMGTIGIILLAGILLIFMPLLIHIIVPQFSPEKQTATVYLSRLLLFSPIFFALSYLFSAILNSYKRFIISSFAPLIYNLSIIIATIFFGEKYGVYAVVWGVIAGAFWHMLIQALPLRSLGVRLSFVWGTSNLLFKKVIRLMIPRSIGLGALQIMVVSFTAIASGLGSGSVAILQLADNIQTMPTVVFGTSVASALFPTLAEHFSLGKLDQFSQHIKKAIITIIYFLLPASIAIILLRIQIVRLVLGSGEFGWAETKLTAQTLGFFAVSVVFSGLQPLFARAYYALQNTRTPAYFSLISVAVSILLGYYFGTAFGVAGLALAFTCGSILNTWLLYNGLKKKLSDLDDEELWSKILKIILGTFAMAVSIQLVKISIGTIYDLDRFHEVAFQAGISVAIGFTTYFATTYILGFKEFQLLGLERLMGVFNGRGQNGGKQS